MHIGLLEDDLSQIELISIWTEEMGDNLKSYTTGKSFRKAIDSEHFDLLVLDWHLPDTTGLDELDWLRGEKRFNTPVIFITSRDSEESVVEALEHGANDYMVKPVNKNITIARIKALQRRFNQEEYLTDTKSVNSKAHQTANIDVFEPYKVNHLDRSISRNDEVVKLTNKEFELASYLFRNAGCLIARDTLMDVVWGTQADLNTRTVDTHVSKIRSKLGIKPAIGWQLKSIYQRGYRLFPVSEV